MNYNKTKAELYHRDTKKKKINCEQMSLLLNRYQIKSNSMMIDVIIEINNLLFEFGRIK